MEYSVDGVKEFNTKDFFEHKELFEELAENKLRTPCLSGCSDSRVVPNLITKTVPGELFMIRNVVILCHIIEAPRLFLQQLLQLNMP